jgi:bacteriorhodopsin
LVTTVTPNSHEKLSNTAVDRFVTTPLLLLDLLLTAGLPWPTILIVILADEFMIVTGLVGALVSSSYKWGYWMFGMFAFFYVVYSLVFVGRRHASMLGGQISKTYMTCGVLTIFLWFLYPIAWGLCEGGNVLHPDSEGIFYGILDIFAKPVFGFLLLAGHRNISVADLGLHIADYDDVAAGSRTNAGATEKRGIFGRRTAGNSGVGANTAANPAV